MTTVTEQVIEGNYLKDDSDWILGDVFSKGHCGYL